LETETLGSLVSSIEEIIFRSGALNPNFLNLTIYREKFWL